MCLACTEHPGGQLGLSAAPELTSPPQGLGQTRVSVLTGFTSGLSTALPNPVQEGQLIHR